MEQIVKTYGKFLLEAAAFIIFWMSAFLGVRDLQGNIGFFRMLGACLVEERVEYGEDFQTCVDESRRNAPVIFYRREGALDTGTYTVSELIGATDCEGRELVAQVQDMYNSQGISDMQMLNPATEQICFEVPGIYMLRVRAVDCWNGTSNCWICVPVN